MNECIVCGTRYEAKRATSRYCGAKCRKLAFRSKDSKLSVPVSVPPDNVTVVKGGGPTNTPLSVISLAYYQQRDRQPLTKDRQLSKHGFNE